MRNKYKGICYKCNKIVEVNKGYFERDKGKWRVQCFSCAKIKYYK
jgi:hypothetical protein